MKAYIQTKRDCKDGTFDSYRTQEVEIKETSTPRAGRTICGYGARVPTGYMIRYNNRWRRVYCICYGNTGTLFIGPKYDQCLTVRIDI